MMLPCGLLVAGAAVPHDEVIQGAHVEQCERLLEPACDQLIRPRGLEHPRRVIVGEDHSGCVVQQGLAEHLTRVHSRHVDGAAKELLEGDQPVTAVEIQTAEDLVGPVP